MNPELIEKYRHFNVEYTEWWDCTYDDFKSDMAEKFITVRDMSFSGFWSQGDGASFIGYIHNNKEFLRVHDISEDDYPAIHRLMAHDGSFSIDINRSMSRYVHENTVSAEIVAAEGFVHILPSDDFRDHIISQWDEELNREYDRLQEEVTSIIRDYCRQLYKSLKEEYCYLTSDEAVWEALVANELDEIEEENV